jgi:dTDP-4-amino-4,6-dideoxygalactose transaminase
MRVPLLDLQRQNLPLQAELTAAFRRVLESGRFVLGSEVEAFEAAAAAVAGARFGIGMSSGTDAILAALMALDIGPGDEAICPSFTFFATGGCVARLGAMPVFADSRPECFNLDPAAIEPLITPRTKAIVPVHLFGQPADLEPILEIARRHNLAVIEDAAQALGAEYRGRPVGSFGHFGAVSFFPTKNLGALGDAGLLVTNDAQLAEKARRLRNHGMHPRYIHRMVGGNFRLDALQAALLAVKLPHLASYTALRQQHARAYTNALGKFPPNDAVEIVPPALGPDRTHIVNQYTIRVRPGPRWRRAESPRDLLRQWLTDRDIASEIYYPVPLHAQECFRHLGPFPALPVAERAAAEVLSLPVFPELTEEEQAAVVTAIAEFAAEAGCVSDRPGCKPVGLRVPQ